MSPGQMLPGQMSQLNLKCVLDVPNNLPLKFGSLGSGGGSGGWWVVGGSCKVLFT